MASFYLTFDENIHNAWKLTLENIQGRPKGILKGSFSVIKLSLLCLLHHFKIKLKTMATIFNKSGDLRRFHLKSLQCKPISLSLISLHKVSAGGGPLWRIATVIFRLVIPEINWTINLNTYSRPSTFSALTNCSTWWEVWMSGPPHPRCCTSPWPGARGCPGCCGRPCCWSPWRWRCAPAQSSPHPRRPHTSGPLPAAPSSGQPCYRTKWSECASQTRPGNIHHSS